MDRPCDEILFELLQEYQLLREAGERPSPEDFRAAAGGCYSEFVELLGADERLEREVEALATEALPRKFGDYSLLEVLGKGGVGIVYRAVQRSLTRTVALKRLRVGWSEEGDLLRRFLRGARAAAQVEHDHAVRIYDSGAADGEPYLVMSLLPGATLEEILFRLKNCGPLPFGPAHHKVLDELGVPGSGHDTESYVRRVAALLAGPVDALGEYHRVSIVHRDVKPGNLMMDDHGRLVLTDFDLVKDLDTLAATMTRSPVGTPLYMSPEQWSYDKVEVDGQADIYSIGAVFYELLTLRPPFETEGFINLREQVRQKPPTDPRRYCADLPPAACRVALQALEKRPADRQADAAGLALDLRRLAAGEEVSARPVPALKRLGRRLWARKFRFGGVLLAAAALLAVYVFRTPTVELHVLPSPPGGSVYLARISAGQLGAEEFVGIAPVTDCRLPGGDYRIRIHHKGWGEYETVIHLDTDTEEPVLVEPRIPFERITEEVEEYLAELGLDLDEKVERFRRVSGFEGPARLLYPRGRVRLEDLVALDIEVAADAEPGDLVVLTPEGEEIYRKQVGLPKLRQQVAIPPELVARLVIGREYDIGFTFEGADPVLQRLQIVAGPGADTVSGVRALAAAQGSEVARLLVIELYRREGLPLAAWQSAMGLGKEWPRRRVYARALAALEDLGLAKTPLAREVLAEYDRCME